jgi:hypothetical protein
MMCPGDRPGDVSSIRRDAGSGRATGVLFVRRRWVYAATRPADNGAMSLETNKELIRRFYTEIDEGNIDVLDELVDENYLDHSPAPFPGLEAPGARD